MSVASKPLLGRRPILRGGAATAMTAFAAPAAFAFPDQPVRLVVPWNAGGLADAVARALAGAISGPLGQPLVVENRTGANGAIGALAVAQARGDGHILVLASAETHAINPLIYPRLPYDATADFTPITVFARAPFVLITRPGLGADSLAAFLRMARARRGQLTYASWGIGSTSHLAMERLMREVQVELLHIPFTGSAPASVALLAGQVDAMFLNASPAEAMARDGRARILGAGATERIPLLAQVPTLGEQGIHVEATNWFGVLGPARMPAAAAHRVAAASAEALRTPAVQEAFRVQAALPVTMSPDETRAFIAADRERWSSLVRELNMRLE